MLRRLLIITCLGLSVFLLCSAFTYRIGGSPNDGDAIVEAIENVADISDEREEMNRIGGEVIIESNTSVVRVDIDDDTDIEVSSPEMDPFSIELPTSAEDAEVVEDTLITYDDDYAVGTEVGDGEIRTSFIIEDKDAPEEYDVTFNLSEGLILRFAQDMDGDEDGSIEAVDADGLAVIAIDLPYAFDAAGKPVPTYYRLTGTTVTQIVEHRNREDIAYPIVADPSTKFSSWFVSGKWIMRGNKRSLSLIPKPSLRVVALEYHVSSYASIASNAVANASWTSVYKKYKSSKYWKNTNGMRKQFYCHFYGAIFKRDFNLEPSRPNVSWGKTVAARCNP